MTTTLVANLDILLLLHNPHLRKFLLHLHDHQFPQLRDTLPEHFPGGRVEDILPVTEGNTFGSLRGSL